MDSPGVLDLKAQLAQARAHYAADWQRAEDALVAAGVEMWENGDRLTIEDAIARLAQERDELREKLDRLRAAAPAPAKEDK